MQITDERPSQWVEKGCTAEGFLPGARPTAVPLRGTATISDVAAVLAQGSLARRLDPAHAETLRPLEPTPEAAHSVEGVFHPIVITGAGLRTIRVPIQPAYAVELFDHTLSEGRLWSRERPVALRREHVYFRAPTATRMLAPPARLLWQVTGPSRQGGRTLRGWSLLDDAVVGSVEKLIDRFSHLGVLDPQEIRSMSKGGLVMALRFSHTTVFDRPITLDEYREVMQDLLPGVGLTHAGPQPVDERVFARLATLRP